MMQVAWRLWKPNITCKRLDLKRLKLIDEYLLGYSLMVGGLIWVVDPDILGSSPLGEFPWITWYTILASGVMYRFNKLFKKEANWWTIFNQEGQRIVSKTMTFYFVTVGCINRFLQLYCSVSAVTFLDCLALVICKS